MDSSSKHPLGEMGTELEGVVASLRAIGPRTTTQPGPGIRLRTKGETPHSSDKRADPIDEREVIPILMQAGEVYQTVMKMVAGYCRVEIADLLGKTRGEEEIALARQTVMYLLRKSFSMSFLQIGKLIGRDHTTVMHACSKIERQRTFDETVNADLTKLEGMLAPLSDHVKIVEASPVAENKQPVEDSVPAADEAEASVPTEVVSAAPEAQKGDQRPEEDQPTEQTTLPEAPASSEKKARVRNSKKAQPSRSSKNEFADKVTSLMSGFFEETLAQLLPASKRKNTRRKT